MTGIKSIQRIVAFVMMTAAILILSPVLSAQTYSREQLKVSSKSGYFQFGLGGRMILEGFAPGRDASGLIVERGKFLSGRAGLFADFYMGKHVYVTGEFRLDTGEAPRSGVLTGRVEQAFVRYKPWLNQDFHIQYGKSVSPFGAYSQRHDTAADPFIRPPLMYDYRTMASSEVLPRSNEGFISWKFAPNIWRPVGAPMIWGNPYQVGAMFFGGYRKVDFRLAAMNSATSSEPQMWNYQIGQKNRPSYVAHIRYRILPEFYLGMAYSAGPYLGDGPRASIGRDAVNSNQQKTWEVEFLYERGKTQVRGEAFHDRWAVPNVIDDPVDVSGYVEIKQKFLPGFYGALRYGTMRFNKIRLSSEKMEAWDFDIWRGQAALGYRILRNLEVRAEYMLNHTDGPNDPKDNLLSLQCRFEF
jgi:hypothetical protein